MVRVLFTHSVRVRIRSIWGGGVKLYCSGAEPADVTVSQTSPHH